MALEIKRLQLYAITNLISNLDKLMGRGLATIKSIAVLYNSRTPNMVYVRYEKAERGSDEYGFKHILLQINQNGDVESIGDKFADIFAISAFLSECKPIDMNNINDYLVG